VLGGAVSLLAAWFQLAYAAVTIAASFKLATAFRMLASPEYAAAFGGNVPLWLVIWGWRIREPSVA